MPIEIRILSGSRQGEQLWLDGEVVGVGEGADCQIRFPSEDQPAVRGRKGSLRLNQDGWQFRNQGQGEWFINHFAVPPQGTSPLRSGDIVRMSANGPDFQFSVVSGRKPIAAAANNAMGPMGTMGPIIPINPMTAASPAAAIPATISAPANPQAPPANVTVAMNLPLPIVLACAGVMFVAVVVLAILLRSGSQPSPSSAAINPAPPPTQPVDPPTPISVPSPVPPEPKPISPPTVPSPEKLTVEQLVEKFGGAVVWLGVELEERKLPVCTGWAIGPTTIVSTAAEIAEFVPFHERGNRVFVYCEPLDPPVVTVTQLRVHPVYAKAEADTNSRLLYNVGVLTIEQPLPVHCEVLRAKALPKSLLQKEIFVLGFPISASKESYDAFHLLNRPELEFRVGRIDSAVPLSGAADDLPLLSLDVDVPDGFEGAPVFDSNGKVLGVLTWSDKPHHTVLAEQAKRLLP